MSLIRKLLTACVVVISTLSVEVGAKDFSVEFIEYYDGAISVYSESVEPSVETSKAFHNHLLKNYIRGTCKPLECRLIGEMTATQFVKNSEKVSDEF